MARKTAVSPTISEIRNEKVTQKRGKVKLFDGEPAMLRVSQGVTLNMGNYNSLRLGVDLSIPCDPNKTEEAFTKALAFVEKHLEKMINANKRKEEGEPVDDVEEFGI